MLPVMWGTHLGSRWHSRSCGERLLSRQKHDTVPEVQVMWVFRDHPGFSLHGQEDLGQTGKTGAELISLSMSREGTWSLARKMDSQNWGRVGHT